MFRPGPMVRWVDDERPTQHIPHRRKAFKPSRDQPLSIESGIPTSNILLLKIAEIAILFLHLTDSGPQASQDRLAMAANLFFSDSSMISYAPSQKEHVQSRT